MGTYSFTQLDVWKKAHQVTLEIYRITEAFPKHQLFSLTSQMQRAAYSIPSNIAEGYGKLYPRDKARIYNIAYCSADELRYFLILSRDKGYRTADPSLDRLLDDVSGMLRRLTEAVLRGP